jgi:hypothetical protein
MKAILVCFVGVLVATLLHAKDTDLPILIDIPHARPGVTNCAGKERAFSETIQWLKDISSKFGRRDYVIIRLESNEDILPAAMLARNARDSHDRVYIGLLSNEDANNPYFIVPIGCEDLPFNIQKPNQTTRPISSPQLPSNYPSRDKARDEQIDRFQRIQRGEIH